MSSLLSETIENIYQGLTEDIYLENVFFGIEVIKKENDFLFSQKFKLYNFKFEIADVEIFFNIQNDNCNIVDILISITSSRFDLLKLKDQKTIMEFVKKRFKVWFQAESEKFMPKTLKILQDNNLFNVLSYQEFNFIKSEFFNKSIKFENVKGDFDNYDLSYSSAFILNSSKGFSFISKIGFLIEDAEFQISFLKKCNPQEILNELENSANHRLRLVLSESFLEIKDFLLDDSSSIN